MSAVLRRDGVETFYLNGTNYRKLANKVKKLSPDLILYSCNWTKAFPWYVGFDQYLKNEIDVKSVMGGAATIYDNNHMLKSTIDAICVGEGDIALSEYVKSGFQNTKNIITKEDSSPKGFYEFANLDSLPFPDRDIVYKNDYLLRNSTNKYFMTGRGCPYQCTYCQTALYNKIFKQCGKVARKKSVDYVLEEIAQVKKKYPLNHIVFQDGTFIVDRKWTFEFCEQFSRRFPDLTFSCYIRFNLLDEDMVIALKQAGCVSTSSAIESGNDTIRNKLLKRNMSEEDIVKGSILLNKYGIKNRCGSIVGLPGENLEQMIDTMEMNLKAQIPFCEVNIFVPYPGVELTEYAIEHGYLERQAIRDDLPKNHIQKSIIKNPDVEEKVIKKLACVIPIVVIFPILYRNNKLFNFIMRNIPTLFIRVSYEIIYTILSIRNYKIFKMPLHHMFLMGLRYMKSGHDH